MLLPSKLANGFSICKMSFINIRQNILYTVSFDTSLLPYFYQNYLTTIQNGDNFPFQSFAELLYILIMYVYIYIHLRR